LKVVIPAAGLGKRFVDAGITSPKELLLLGGKPLIGHALAEASRAGFDAAVVVVSPAKVPLRDYLAEGNHPLPVEVILQPEPRGIGDAVLLCWNGDSVGVLLPDDVVLDSEHWSQLIALNAQSGAATLCVRRVPKETIGRFGIVERDGKEVVRVFEKPGPGTTTSNLAIFGRYVVTEQVIAGLRSTHPTTELELTFGFAAAITTAAGVRTVDFAAEIYDCGTPAAYAESKIRFRGTVRADA
jgi:UTP--glucose-1-phosphate uridylyltransferase